jgi:hypothetical protein
MDRVFPEFCPAPWTMSESEEDCKETVGAARVREWEKAEQNTS